MDIFLVNTASSYLIKINHSILLICTVGRHDIMMTSSNGNIFRVTGRLCVEFYGEFPAQRPVTRSFDVLFDLR